MQVDPEPVVVPRRHRHRPADPVVTMHVTPERPAPALTLRITLSAKRSHYRVRSGDSLWRIAQSLVGSGAGSGRVVSTVHLLWSLNRGRIASGNENLLATSDVLRIPARREVR
jgi:Tfp pilus assembly protein FimV